MKRKFFASLLFCCFFAIALLFFITNAEGATEDRRVIFDAYDLADPFAPKLPIAKEVKTFELQSQKDVALIREVMPPRFTIQGVIWNTDTPQAIVDNVVVGIGGVIKEAYIVDITKEGIKILYQDTLFFVETETSISSKLE